MVGLQYLKHIYGMSGVCQQSCRVH